MSDPDPSPGTAAFDGSFAAGMIAHLQEFQRGRDGTGPIFVTIRLFNEATIYVEGLQIDHLDNVPGCIMIRGGSPPSRAAIVIREDHILMAQYDTEPGKELGLGF